MFPGALQDELQEEVAQEMATYNLDPFVEGMTDDQYTSAMAELARRRAALLAGKSPEEQRRLHAMRNNMLWHLHTVSAIPICPSPPPPPPPPHQPPCPGLCRKAERALGFRQPVARLDSHLTCSLVSNNKIVDFLLTAKQHGGATLSVRCAAA